VSAPHAVRSRVRDVRGHVHPGNGTWSVGKFLHVSSVNGIALPSTRRRREDVWPFRPGVRDDDDSRGFVFRRSRSIARPPRYVMSCIRRAQATRDAQVIESLESSRRHKKVKRTICPHTFAMCESRHARKRKQVARMVADLRQGKPTERWRRKVSGLKSLRLHDSGTAEIQSALWAASVLETMRRTVGGVEGAMTGNFRIASVLVRSMRSLRLLRSMRHPRLAHHCARNAAAFAAHTAMSGSILITRA
jgi:hypothetical protein